MSAAFKVGEVAMYQNCFFPENEGRECVVISSLKVRAIWLIGRRPCYWTQTSDGEKRLTEPHQLRKKQPPRSAKSIMREAILKAKQPQMEPA